MTAAAGIQKVFFHHCAVFICCREDVVHPMAVDTYRLVGFLVWRNIFKDHHCSTVEIRHIGIKNIRLNIILCHQVIIDMASLTTEQKVFACRAIEQVGADFVCAGTGWQSTRDTTPADIVLMKEAAPRCQVKAAGVQSADSAIALLEAGADRIGTTCAIHIMHRLNGEAGQ